MALVSGGLGIVGLGLGAVFGGLALGDQNMEKSNCSTGGCPNRPQAQADYTTGGSNATGSTVAFAVGGALVAAGIVLFVTAPTAPRGGGSARLYLAPWGDGHGLVIGGGL
jgi:hypothetical protein